MRNKVLALLPLLLGLFMLFFGVTAINDNSVSCEGKPMHSGDTCRSFDRRTGRSTTRSFDEMRENKHRSAWIGLVGGPPVLVGGIVWTVKAYRRRPAAP